MPWFKYEAQDKTGRVSSGVMMARDQVEIHQRLVSGGYAVVSVVLAGQNTDANPALKQEDVSGKSMLTAPHAEMMVFFTGLADMLKSGINLYEALTHEAGQTRNRALHEISLALSGLVQSGVPLSVAMENYPKAFPMHVRGTIAAGELGGFLPFAVGDIANDYEIALKSSTRIARFLSVFIWVNAISLMVFIPLGPLFFRGVFSLGDPAAQYLGLGEKLMMVVQPLFRFIVMYSLPALALYLFGYYMIKHHYSLPQNRLRYYELLLRIPRMGRISKERSLASFSKILWRLQTSGILPIQSWEAASKTPENLFIAETLAKQTDRIRGGVTFSDALTSTGLFSEDDQRILETSEKSGRATDSLQRIASFYQDAALVSAGRSRWVSTRIGCLVWIIVLGLIAIFFWHSYFSFIDSVVKWVTEGM